MHLQKIGDLERANQAMRAAVESRQAAANVVLQQVAAESRSATDGIPSEFLEANAKWTMAPATPVPPITEPVCVHKSIPNVEAAWAGIKARRQEMLEDRRKPEPQVIRTIPLAPAATRTPQTLIGITGRAGAGKTLAACMVPDGYVMQFADPLYAMLAAMLDVDDEQLRHRAIKEVPVAWLGKSPRELLQTLGTEWGRRIVGEDVWIRIACRTIERLRDSGIATPIVVADVRFDNEAQAIRSMGGEVWEIVRDPEHLVPSDHPSESGITQSLVDRVIDNTGTVDELRACVAAAVCA